MSYESSGDFLRGGEAPKLKPAIEYEKAEMQADMSAFSPAEQAAVKKFLNEESLEPPEAAILKTARERWFDEKYGVPYHNKAASREVIMRKYAPPEELTAAHELQARLFAEFANGTAESVARVKAEYLEKYPDQAEGVEILFGVQEMLELGRKLHDPERKIKDKAERMRAFQDLTEMNFMLTHFVAENRNDKVFLNLFWSALEKIASANGYSADINMLRKGTITQVATMRVFQELGMSPKMSHPRDDAFNKIDLWSDEAHAVQIKSTGAEEPEVVETDEIAFPGTEVMRDGRVEHYNSKRFLDMQDFRAKVNEYGKLTNQPNLKGYFIAIPYSKVDFTTGEPDKGLIRTIGQKLGAKPSASEKLAA